MFIVADSSTLIMDFRPGMKIIMLIENKLYLLNNANCRKDNHNDLIATIAGVLTSFYCASCDDVGKMKNAL